MEFSNVIQHTGQCVTSPDGRHIASCQEHKLVVRDSQTMDIVQVQHCQDAIQYIEWSADGLYVLCAMFRRSLVQVWALEEPDWTCKIDEGSAGLDGVRWAPDGRHILTWAKFQLRITVWSLVSQHTCYIKLPKYSVQGCEFSPNGKYFAVLERKDCKDYVSIFSCDVWQMLRHFPVSSTDATDVIWSPDNACLCVQDTVLEYRASVYTIDGHLLGDYSAYENALGIKKMQWSPSSQFLAIGSFDESVRLLNHVTWRKICTLPHEAEVEGDSTVVYREEEVKAAVFKQESFPNTGSLHPTRSLYKVAEGRPYDVPKARIDPEKPNPRMGVSWMAFSPNSRFLATRNDNQAGTMWIWDIESLRLAVVLHHISSLRDAAWHPVDNTLALCTGGAKLFLWREDGCSCVEIPTDARFSCNTLAWFPDGSSLLLRDKDRFCVCAVPPST